MTEWKEDKLENVAQLQKNPWHVGDRELPYIGLEHIIEGNLRLQGIGNSKTVGSNKYYFDSDCFLFGKLRPYFRKLYRPDFKGVCSTDFWVVKPIKDNDKDFLFYFFANQEFVDFTYSGSAGTRMPRADWNFVSKSIWKFPEPPEQRAIASVLSSLDNKIDLLHRQNKTLEQMVEALFRQWFVEEASDELDSRPLSSIATFLNGLACQKYPPENESEKLPVLKIKELRNGIAKDCDYCTSNVKPEYIIENGDVIFSWSGSLMVKIWNGQPCVLNQHLFKVISDEFPKWYYYLWCKHHLNDFINISSSHATTMGHIKRRDLNEAMVLVPKPNEMKYYSEIITPLFDKIILNNKQITNLEALRDALLPKLISGEVNIETDG